MDRLIHLSASVAVIAGCVILLSCSTKMSSDMLAQNPEMTENERNNTVSIDKLWAQVNETLRNMGRPDRLYKIDPQRTAMLVIDMQDAFCAPWGCIENPDTRKIVGNINALAKVCREARIPVIWIRFVLRRGNSNAGLWPLFQPASPYKGRKNPTTELSENGGETKLWKELIVNPEEDFDVVKNRYSAFIPGSSDLERLLRTLQKDTVIITGVGTNVCSESTARDAMMLDFKVIFVGDANATIGKVFHEVTLMNIKMFFGDVVTTSELIGELSKTK